MSINAMLNIVAKPLGVFILFFLLKGERERGYISCGTQNKEKANNHYFVWNNRVYAKKTKRRRYCIQSLFISLSFFGGCSF